MTDAACHFREYGQVIQVNDHIFVAVGYALANSICVKGVDGLIIIDTCESNAAAAECLAEFRKLSDLPIKAIIYTHFHHDHVGGAQAFKAAAAPDCQIWAHASTGERMLNFNVAMGPLAFVRGARQFGSSLTAPALENSGIGPRLRMEASSQLLPTHSFSTPRQLLRVSGVDLVPSRITFTTLKQHNNTNRC